MTERWHPPHVEQLEAWQILRGVRWERSLSQRELAAASGLPHSTISRIESGKVQPKFETLCRIVRSCGYAVFVACPDPRRDPIQSDPFAEQLRDRGFRRVPAHLPVWLVDSMFSRWWGWNHIGWTLKDQTVPKHTYARRPRRESGAWYRWDDAT